ncbi:MAG: M14 family metallopeptidase [Clostridiales bacterium]|nr:M14 family metallopeptidase [Clostridiales bacterium]
MRRNIIFELKSPYRDNMRITSFEFGSYNDPGCENSLAILGSTRGNEFQQLYSTSRIVEALRILESEGQIEKGKKIVVIPTANNYSFNLHKRFWSLDNTDINRMFPGYDLGETTQRIAYGVFEYVKGYNFGIQLTSFYQNASFLPHVRMMHTGYENPEAAEGFGLPYVYIRNSRPYDTTTLNYNWQIWETTAFSLYIGETEKVSEKCGDIAVDAVVNFLKANGICKGSVENPKKTELLKSSDLAKIKIQNAGFIKKLNKPGDIVRKGQIMGYVYDPYDHSTLETLISPVDGTVFYAIADDMTYQKATVYRIIRETSF